jgi:hypothetical protein
MSAVVAKTPAAMTRSDLLELAMPISLYRGGQAETAGAPLLSLVSRHRPPALPSPTSDR